MFQVAVGTRGSSSCIEACIVTSVVNYFTRVVHPQEMSTSPHTRSKRGRTKEEMHISTEVGDRWHLIAPKCRIPRCGFSMHRRSKKPEFATLSAASPTSIRWPCVSFTSRTRAFFNASVATHKPLSLSLSLLADPLNEHKHKLVSSNRAAGRARSLRTVNWWVNLLWWMSEGVGFFFFLRLLGEGRESFLLIRFS